MNKEITKKQKCISQRNGIEIWLDEETANKLQDVLDGITEHKFIRFMGRSINTADCTGVYLPEDMQDLTRRKNGQWKCKENYWHDKGIKCDCVNKQEKERLFKKAEAIAKCGKCSNGWIESNNAMTLCECIKSL